MRLVIAIVAVVALLSSCRGEPGSDFNEVSAAADRVIAAISHPSVLSQCPSRVRLHVAHRDAAHTVQQKGFSSGGAPSLALEVWKDAEEHIGELCPLRWLDSRAPQSLVSEYEKARNQILGGIELRIVDHGKARLVPEAASAAVTNDASTSQANGAPASTLDLLQEEEGAHLRTGMFDLYELKLLDWKHASDDYMHNLGEKVLLFKSERLRPFVDKLSTYLVAMCEKEGCDPNWVFVAKKDNFAKTPSFTRYEIVPHDTVVKTLFEKGERSAVLFVYIMPRSIPVSVDGVGLNFELDRTTQAGLTVGELRTMAVTEKAKGVLPPNGSNIHFDLPDDTVILDHWLAGIRGKHVEESQSNPTKITVSGYVSHVLEAGLCTGGVGIGNNPCHGGSLGGFVVSTSGDDQSTKYALSNAHVMCALDNSDLGKLSEENSDVEFDCGIVMGPDYAKPNVRYAATTNAYNGQSDRTYERGTTAHDEAYIAEGARRFGNVIAGGRDVAAATVEGELSNVVKCGSYDIGPVHGLAEPAVGASVIKFGFRTKMTHGIIYSTASGWIKTGEYSGWTGHEMYSKDFDSLQARFESLKAIVADKGEEGLNLADKEFYKQMMENPEKLREGENSTYAAVLASEIKLNHGKLRKFNYREEFYVLERIPDFTPDLDKVSLKAYDVVEDLSTADVVYKDSSFGWHGDSGSMILDISTVPGRRLAVGQLSAGRLAKRSLADGKTEFAMLGHGYRASHQINTLNAYRASNQEEEPARDALESHYGGKADMDRPLRLCHSIVVPATVDLTPDSASKCTATLVFNPRSEEYGAAVRVEAAVPPSAATIAYFREVSALLREHLAPYNTHADPAVMESISVRHSVKSMHQAEIGMVCGGVLLVDSAVTANGAVVLDGFVSDKEDMMIDVRVTTTGANFVLPVGPDDTVADVKRYIRQRGEAFGGASIVSLRWYYTATRTNDRIDETYKGVEITPDDDAQVYNIFTFNKAHNKAGHILFYVVVDYDKCVLTDDNCAQEGTVDPSSRGVEPNSPDCKCSCPEAWKHESFPDGVLQSYFDGRNFGNLCRCYLSDRVCNKTNRVFNARTCYCDDK